MTSRSARSIFVGAACSIALSVGAARASTCELTAEPGARLLELYTSEGCSSCPPADRYFSRLQADKRLIPLAFHVDYWNDLGWPDRFSEPRYAERQRRLAANQLRPSVYTPGYFLNGMEWRSQSEIPDSATTMLALQVRIRATAQQVQVKRVSKLPSGAVWYAAISENGLKTQVARGENAGKLLRHDFVVRALSTGSADSDTLAFPVPSDVSLENAAVAVWVETGAQVRAATRSPLSECMAASTAAER